MKQVTTIDKIPQGLLKKFEEDDGMMKPIRAITVQQCSHAPKVKRDRTNHDCVTSPIYIDINTVGYFGVRKMGPHKGQPIRFAFTMVAPGDVDVYKGWDLTALRYNLLQKLYAKVPVHESYPYNLHYNNDEQNLIWGVQVDNDGVDIVNFHFNPTFADQRALFLAEVLYDHRYYDLLPVDIFAASGERPFLTAEWSEKHTPKEMGSMAKFMIDRGDPIQELRDAQAMYLRNELELQRKAFWD